MTREEAKALLPIIQAWADGKSLQFDENGDGKEWKDITFRPNFDMKATHYRIKPKPKYRPFQSAEECWQEMRKHQPFGWVKDWQGFVQIQSVWTDRPPEPEDEEEEEDDLHISIYAEESENSDEAFERYTFADGTPFGVEVKE